MKAFSCRVHDDGRRELTIAGPITGVTSAAGHTSVAAVVLATTRAAAAVVMEVGKVVGYVRPILLNALPRAQRAKVTRITARKV